jgi:hypothetical protein
MNTTEIVMEAPKTGLPAETNSTSSCDDGDSTPQALATAPGKFAPAPKSLQTMTTAELRDRITELNTHLGMHNMSFTGYRRALGQALNEMRTRIAAHCGLVLHRRA